jgi:MarR family transcriptional regulator, organic hydroperoxide resistance regulator
VSCNEKQDTKYDNFILAYTNIIQYIYLMKKERDKYCKCLYYSTNALGRIMTKMAEEEFSLTGLNPSYAFLLMIVNEKPGVQPTELSELMMLTPSTITRLVDKLVDKGYIERKINGKLVFLNPTGKSIELDPKLKEAWVRLYKRYTSILGENQANILTIGIYDAAMKLEEN